ncbi:recombinase family protein [Salmonella enterica]|nr:recombinase family protein [Salmonella enterica]EGM2345287.1 recombinase family protein [Salmonella enterica]EGM2363788.1 recombinase family protein [Salmonella enterica]
MCKLAQPVLQHGDTLIAARAEGEPTHLAICRASIPDAREIVSILQVRNVKLMLGACLHDQEDSAGKIFFNMLVMFAEFENDLIRLRTREDMVVRAKGKPRGKQPKLSEKPQEELCRMHETGQYPISDLVELFSVSRPTAYRTLLCNHKE